MNILPIKGVITSRGRLDPNVHRRTMMLLVVSNFILGLTDRVIPRSEIVRAYLLCKN